MKEISLSHRLIFVFSMLFIAILGMSAGITFWHGRALINKDYDAQLISEAHLLWMIASEEVEEPKGLEQIDLDFGAPSMSPQQRAVLSQYTQWRAFRIWKDGKLAEMSDTSKELKAPPAASGFSDYKQGKNIWRVYSIHEPKEDLVIEAWEKRDNRNRLLYGMIDELIEPVFVLLPLLILFLILGVRYGLRDLLAMSKQISGRKADDLSKLQFEKLPRELRSLKKAINSLLDKLQIMLEREHQFIDNAAHELKTPLAVLTLQSQLIQEAPTERERDECIKVLQEGVERTRKVFDQILILSRISDKNIFVESCSLLALLQRIIAERATMAANKGIEVSLDGEDRTVQTNPDLLSILLGILIDNAVKYTPENGQINVLIKDNKIEVTDSGPGIPDDEKEKVFDRFYRVKGDNTQGSGLGLAIARKCADILDACITMKNTPGNSGLKVMIELP